MENWYSGTSGLVLPVPNKSYYPKEYQPGSRLHYYGSLYNSIEINSTFYRLPRPGTITRWATEVPKHFTFTFKVPSSVSHAKEMKFDKRELIRFMEVIEGATLHRGFLLLQVPAKMQANVPRLSHILRLLNKTGWPIAFESRNESWYTPAVDRVLLKHNAVRVIHDWWSFKIRMESNSSMVYLRFHGPEKNYRGSYSDDFLKKCAAKIRRWLKEGKVVYAYFNNTLGNVSGNVQMLNEMLQKRAALKSAALYTK